MQNKIIHAFYQFIRAPPMIYLLKMGLERHTIFQSVAIFMKGGDGCQQARSPPPPCIARVNEWLFTTCIH